MSAQATVRWSDDGGVRTGGLDVLDTTPEGSVVWIDVLGPDEQVMESVARRFDLHPLAVEDCLHYPQRPKLDTYEHGLFLIWLIPEQVADDGLNLRELDVFIGQDFLVTVHRERLDAIDRVAAEAERVLPRGSDWTLHAIIDIAVDSVFPILDALSDTLEELEDRMLESAEREHLHGLYAARRLLVALHKVVGSERDVLRGLVREEALVSAEAYRYFQDIGDHLARVEDGVETYRDVASGAMDIYLSAVSNRLNVIMKQLTIVATIFMPLTWISGIYGMNFQYMPELEWRYGYAAVMVGMLVIAAGMLAFVRRRGWW